MLLALAVSLGLAWIFGLGVLHVASPAIHILFFLASAAAIAHIAIHSPRAAHA